MNKNGENSLKFPNVWIQGAIHEFDGKILDF